MIRCCNIPPRPLVEKPVKKRKKTEKKNDSVNISLGQPMENGDFWKQKKTCSVVVVAEADRGHLVNGELGAEMVENVVGGCGEAAGVSENKVRSH